MNHRSPKGPRPRQAGTPNPAVPAALHRLTAMRGADRSGSWEARKLAWPDHVQRRCPDGRKLDRLIPGSANWRFPNSLLREELRPTRLRSHRGANAGHRPTRFTGAPSGQPPVAAALRDGGRQARRQRLSGDLRHGMSELLVSVANKSLAPSVFGLPDDVTEVVFRVSRQVDVGHVDRRCPHFLPIRVSQATCGRV